MGGRYQKAAFDKHGTVRHNSRQMSSQTKQIIAFFAAAGITALILTWLSFSPTSTQRRDRERGIPHTEEHLAMSSISRSLSEMLPSVYGIPSGDAVIVPKGQGWRVVVFGVADPKRQAEIQRATEDFSKKNADVGTLEVIFDTPPK